MTVNTQPWGRQRLTPGGKVIATDDELDAQHLDRLAAALRVEVIEQPQPKPDVDAEIAAIGAIALAMASVDESARDRIAGWVFDRYRMPDSEVTG